MESKDSGDGKQNTADMTQFVSFLDSIVSFLQGSNSSPADGKLAIASVILFMMGERISELEQSINDLRAEMGAEGTPPPPAPSKTDD
ncbi:hypothetical protein QVD17_17018 [Tagetes erecta]|uniref:Uncharacterized protein n=1 Tax=Tagetes erecta TaxID=13708 RepID=A0AAD8KRK1_TARER|nr:hypothetical protein QVD17_17018 [Tagetes erecta]